MNDFATTLSGQQFILPELLLGSAEAKPDVGSMRVALPSLWRPAFSASAYVLAGRMGRYPCTMLFPEANIKAVLAQISDVEIKEVLERSANRISVDSQHRVVIPDHLRSLDPGQTVSFLGASSHLKVVASDIAYEIMSGDEEVVTHFFREVE